MTFKLKSVGLSTFVVLLLAFTASSALAAEYHAESAPVRVTGSLEGKAVFDAASNSVTCTSISGESTSSTTTGTVLTAVGQVSNCTFFGVAVTVNLNGCSLVVYTNLTGDVVCPVGKAITFQASILGASCQVTVPPQEGLESATVTNIGSGTTREVTVAPNISGVEYTQAGSLCGAHNEGRLTTAPIRVTGETDPGGTHIGVWYQ